MSGYGKGEEKRILTALLCAVLVLLQCAGCSFAGSGGQGAGEYVESAGAGETAEAAKEPESGFGEGSATGAAEVSIGGGAKESAEDSAAGAAEASIGGGAKESAESSAAGVTEASIGGGAKESAEDSAAGAAELSLAGATEAGAAEGSAAEGSEEEIGAEESAAESKGLVVIDPGHQRYANTEKEPIGPGASETKMKVSGGAAGAASGVPEYQLVLEVAVKLRDLLEERGFDVIMTREDNDVDISNSERAQVANEADADVFVRIHANSVGDSGCTGAMTICQTPGNDFNGELYEESRALSDCILEAYTEKTGIRYERVWETDTMSGINWSAVPVTIIEMGYLSNRAEDLSMQDPQMQESMAEGIAEGIEAYFSIYPKKERDSTGGASGTQAAAEDVQDEIEEEDADRLPE